MKILKYRIKNYNDLRHGYLCDLTEMMFRSLRIRQRHEEICDCFDDRIPLLLTLGLAEWIVESKTKS